MPAHITQKMMYRFLGRAAEIASEQGMSASVTLVYDGVVAADAIEYRTRHDVVIARMTAANQAKLKVKTTLAAFDAPYREARAVVLAFVPGTVVPDTLKTQSTDTDILDAVTALSTIVQSHSSSAWAKQLLNGAFGTLAPELVKDLEALIDANKALALARRERAKAFDTVYPKFLRFKQVVYDTLGATSKQYRRLSQRAKGKGEEEEGSEETGLEEQTPENEALAKKPEAASAKAETAPAKTEAEAAKAEAAPAKVA